MWLHWFSKWILLHDNLFLEPWVWTFTVSSHKIIYSFKPQVMRNINVKADCVKCYYFSIWTSILLALIFGKSVLFFKWLCTSLIKGCNKISIKLLSFLVGQFCLLRLGLSFKSDSSVIVIISVFCFSITSFDFHVS